MKKILSLAVAALFAANAFAQIPVTGHGDGLKGSYWYGSQDFGNPIPDGTKFEGAENYSASGDFAGNAYLTQPGTHEFDRVDPTIDFDWESGNPFNDHKDGDACGQHCFSIQWEGYILAPVTGDVYIDLTHCDDAFDLEIWDVDDLETSIAKYNAEYLTGWNWDKDFWTIPVSFEEGHFYKIVLKYYDGSWGAHITMKWYSDEYSIDAETIPQAQLYTSLPTEDGITEATVAEGASKVYNLNGVRVAEPSQKGLYIKNGKKFLVK